MRAQRKTAFFSGDGRLDYPMTIMQPTVHYRAAPGLGRLCRRRALCGRGGDARGRPDDDDDHRRLRAGKGRDWDAGPGHLRGLDRGDLDSEVQNSVRDWLDRFLRSILFSVIPARLLCLAREESRLFY